MRAHFKDGYFFWKRAIDIFGSLFLLFLSLPLFLIIPVAIKLNSCGPVIFKQKRAGLGGKEFLMYKFRSMVTDAEQLRSELEIFNMVKGPPFKIKNDPRITKVGKFLRKTSLDEIPQLWNVLRGEMSLVGPRPFPTIEANRDYPLHRERLKVKPGLTCLWQINGRSNISDYQKWLELDLEYINNHSIRLDLKILLKTIPVVISGFGAE